MPGKGALADTENDGEEFGRSEVLRAFGQESLPRALFYGPILYAIRLHGAAQGRQRTLNSGR